MGVLFLLPFFLPAFALTLTASERKDADTFSLLIIQLIFIGAGDSKLLGSTTKVQVLENVVFFRIAWEYQFDGAEMPHSNAVMYSSDVPHARINSSIKRSYSLSGSSTAEDGKESKAFTRACWGCYHSFYFETLPDMEPTQ